MNSFKFRPRLESMDERIVPDAAPVGAPASANVATVNTAVPGSVTTTSSDEALARRVEEINARLGVLFTAGAANGLAILANGALLTAATAAANNPNLSPAEGAAARAEVARLAAIQQQPQAQQNAINAERAALQAELAAIEAEQTRRQQAPHDPGDPIAINPANNQVAA